MKIYRTLRVLASVIIIVIIYFQFKTYTRCKYIIDHESPIEYEYVDRIVHRGGRGEYYSMIVLYKEKQKEVSITSKNYYDITKKKFPVLFYSKENEMIISEWDVKRNFKMILIPFFAFLLIFIPFEKYNKTNMHK